MRVKTLILLVAVTVLAALVQESDSHCECSCQCRDKLGRQCRNLVRRNQCRRYLKYAKKYCKRSCGLCKAPAVTCPPIGNCSRRRGCTYRNRRGCTICRRSCRVGRGCKGKRCGAHSRCHNIKGRGVCKCVRGYTKVRGRCQSLKSCSRKRCGVHSRCYMIRGNPVCKCVRGYERVRRRCRRRNPCKRTRCGAHSRCHIVRGRPECRCLSGYRRVGRRCLSIKSLCGRPKACRRRRGCTYRDSNGCARCKPECWVGRIRPVLVQAIDIIFVVDCSRTIGSVNFRYIIHYLVGVVKQCGLSKNRVRIGLVSFSSRVRVDIRLNQYTAVSQVIEAIRRLQLMSGRPNTHLALQRLVTLFSSSEGGRAYATKVVILLTGGRSLSSTLTIKAARALRRMKIVIYAIGVTNKIYRKELKEIVSGSIRTHCYFIRSYSLLYTITIKIVKTIFVDIGKNPCRPNPCRGNAKCSVNPSGGALCKCQEGYSYTWQNGCQEPNVVEACKEKQTDLVFVVDSSGSIGAKHFSQLKSFLVAIVKKLDISARKMHVGMMTFSTKARVEFPLNKYNNKNDIINAINGVQYMKQHTYTHLALRRLRAMFSAKEGGRRGVTQVALVITDGQSAEFSKTLAEAKKCRDAGITMYALGITGGVNMKEINGIATDPDSEHVFLVRRFVELKEIEAALGKSICKEEQESMAEEEELGAEPGEGENAEEEEFVEDEYE